MKQVTVSISKGNYGTSINRWEVSDAATWPNTSCMVWIRCYYDQISISLFRLSKYLIFIPTKIYFVFVLWRIGFRDPYTNIKFVRMYRRRKYTQLIYLVYVLFLIVYITPIFISITMTSIKSPPPSITLYTYVIAVLIFYYNI